MARLVRLARTRPGKDRHRFRGSLFRGTRLREFHLLLPLSSHVLVHPLRRDISLLVLRRSFSSLLLLSLLALLTHLPHIRSFKTRQLPSYLHQAGPEPVPLLSTGQPPRPPHQKVRQKGALQHTLPLGQQCSRAACHPESPARRTRHHQHHWRLRQVLVSFINPVPPSSPLPSVSACHGAGNDPISPKCYPSLFFSWWSSIFPHPGSHLTNGALRRSSSKYFAFCSMHHLPDITDLVVLELDVDDSA
jgi:hypothetical protein